MKMNNKGQILIVFVLILPLLIMGGVYIFDKCMLLYEYNRLNNLNKQVINEIGKDNIEYQYIEEFFNKNDDSIAVEKIDIDNAHINIVISKNTTSIFGGILGKENYEIVSDITVNR